MIQLSSQISISDYLKLKEKESINNFDYYKNPNNKEKQKMLLNNINENTKFTVNMFLNSYKENYINIYKAISGSYSTKEGIDKLKFTEKFKQLKLLEEIIRQDIKISINKEIARITKEFLINNYEKKYNTTIKLVISALIGEINMNRIIRNQKNVIRDFYLLKSKCIFYDTFLNGKNMALIKNNLMKEKKDIFID